MSHCKGNSYLGGHSLVHVDPVGVSEKKVASRLDRRNSKEDSIRLGNQIMDKLDSINREKSALRKTIIGNGDRVRIGTMSSGWSTYKFQLKRKLGELHRCKIHGADAIARVLNMQGFKTGSGQIWDARTVKIVPLILRSEAKRLSKSKKK